MSPTHSSPRSSALSTARSLTRPLDNPAAIRLMHSTVQSDPVARVGRDTSSEARTVALRRAIRAHPKTFVWLCSWFFSLTVFVVAPPSLLSTVSPDYEPVVQNILKGYGLTEPDGQVIARYPPLYPISLAALRTMSVRLGIS